MFFYARLQRTGSRVKGWFLKHQIWRTSEPCDCRLSIVMEEIRRRPFKVCNSGRTRTIGMVVQSLEELKDRAGNKFGLTPTTCRVFLEKDGTEIDSEEYFSFLDDQTKLMVVNDGEEWMAGSQSKLLKITLIYLVANHCFIRSNFVSTDRHSLKLLLFNMH